MYNILLNIQVKRNITIYDKIVLITRFLINKAIRFVCGVPKSIIYKAFMSAYKLRFLKINNFSNEIYSQLLSVLWEDILDITYQRIYKTKEKKFNFNPDGFAAKILNQYRMFSAKDKKSIAHFLFANTENQAYFKHLLNSSITKEIKLDSLDKTHTSAFISLGTKGLMSNQTNTLQNILVDKIKNIRLSVSTSYKYINDYKPRGVTENYIVTINEIEEKKVEYSYEDSRLFVKKSELLAVFNILNFVLSDRKEILIVHKGI